MAVVVGLLSVAVLNLNNMRDRESDAAVGKRTLAVLLGALGAKYYHYFLIGGAVVILIAFSVQQTVSFSWLVGLGVFPLLFHLLSVIKNKDPKTLDPELKKSCISYICPITIDIH